MNCSKCKKKNIKKANYCKFCGNKFSQEEREEAYNKGFVAKLKKIKKWYELCSLKVITDNIIFKIIILLVVIGIGFYNFFAVGKSDNLTIIDNNIYDVTYNEKLDEYYVVIINNENEDALRLALDLYIPSKVDCLNLKYYDENNKNISSEEFKTTDEIILTANTVSNNYYIISDKNDSENKIKVFVYYDKRVDGNE